MKLARVPLPRALGVVAIATLAVSLSACVTPVADGGTDRVGGGFPITIEHAFGETTISAKPERVATVAWANHGVPLALGVVPVGMSKATWGDDDGDGILPWDEDRLAELGRSRPAVVVYRNCS